MVNVGTLKANTRLNVAYLMIIFRAKETTQVALTGQTIKRNVESIATTPTASQLEYTTAVIGCSSPTMKMAKNTWISTFQVYVEAGNTSRMMAMYFVQTQKMMYVGMENLQMDVT